MFNVSMFVIVCFMTRDECHILFNIKTICVCVFVTRISYDWIMTISTRVESRVTRCKFVCVYSASVCRDVPVTIYSHVVGVLCVGLMTLEQMIECVTGSNTWTEMRKSYMLRSAGTS